MNRIKKRIGLDIQNIHMNLTTICINVACLKESEYNNNIYSEQILILDKSFEIEFEGNRQEQNHYYARVEIYEDGRLATINHFYFDFPGIVEGIKVRNVRALELIDRNTRLNINLKAIRNPLLAWRDEKENEISIYNAEGNICFLKSQLAIVWKLSTGQRTIEEISDVMSLDLIYIFKLIKILQDKGFIYLFKN